MDDSPFPSKNSEGWRNNPSIETLLPIRQRQPHRAFTNVRPAGPLPASSMVQFLKAFRVGPLRLAGREKGHYQRSLV